MSPYRSLSRTPSPRLPETRALDFVMVEKTECRGLADWRLVDGDSDDDPGCDRAGIGGGRPSDPRHPTIHSYLRAASRGVMLSE